eukprot:410654-Prymnesium_polylepis.1
MPRPPHAEPRSGAEPKTRWETNEEEMRMVDKKGERSGRKQKRKEIREQIQEHAGMNRFPEQIRGRTDSGINRFGKRTNPKTRYACSTMVVRNAGERHGGHQLD